MDHTESMLAPRLPLILLICGFELANNRIADRRPDAEEQGGWSGGGWGRRGEGGVSRD